MPIEPIKILQRVIDLMTSPRNTWYHIQEEREDGRNLILHYSAVLAAAYIALGFLGKIIFLPGFSFHFFYSLAALGIMVGALFLLGVLTNLLAPSFGTIRNEEAAFRLIAYASTGIWVVGMLTVIPRLHPLAFVGGFVYTAILFYEGCQVVMGTPREKAWQFTLATMASWFLVVLVALWVVGQIVALVFAPNIMLVKFPRSP